MRANKVHNEIKTGKITPRAREPCEMCRSEMRSSLGVVKLGILHLRLSRGLDARGCRLLRRRSVMPWWRRGSYATIKPLPSTLKYDFLGHQCANPVIISLHLDKDQEEEATDGLVRKEGSNRMELIEP